jgi:hypothetical protein
VWELGDAHRASYEGRKANDELDGADDPHWVFHFTP